MSVVPRASRESGRPRTSPRPRRGDRERDPVHGDASLDRDLAGEVAGSESRHREKLPRAGSASSATTPSTCPCTRCPPSRSPSRRARSRLIGSPVRSRPSRVRSRVSGERSAAKPVLGGIDDGQTGAVDGDAVAATRQVRRWASSTSISRRPPELERGATADQCRRPQSAR